MSRGRSTGLHLPITSAYTIIPGLAFSNDVKHRNERPRVHIVRQFVGAFSRTGSQNMDRHRTGTIENNWGCLPGSQDGDCFQPSPSTQLAHAWALTNVALCWVKSKPRRHPIESKCNISGQGVGDHQHPVPPASAWSCSGNEGSGELQTCLTHEPHPAEWPF